jgi:hypothetical protein
MIILTKMNIMHSCDWLTLQLNYDVLTILLNIDAIR